MSPERRKLERKNFSFYMRVLDETTGMIVGLISDISTNGFKIESAKPIPLNVSFQLRIDQTGEISSRDHLTFTARSRWCQKDPYDPTVYNVGFQLVDMTPADFDTFVKMFNEYGAQKKARHKHNTDYIWG
jgi:hypothetical protein